MNEQYLKNICTEAIVRLTHATMSGLRVNRTDTRLNSLLAMLAAESRRRGVK